MEFFDICDENGNPTGETIERSEAHARGVCHRTVHIWIIRQNEGRTEILLQKRSMEKESFPGLYDTSSAGHIPAGQEPLPSALRELSEELGIEAQPGELTYIGRFRIRYEKPFHGRLFKDNEVTWVYVYRGNVDAAALTLQASEVDEVRWFDLEEVRAEIQHSRERFCGPGGTLELLAAWLERA